MGAWSVSLYGNDDALDLRERFDRLSRLPGAGPELLARLEESFPDLADPHSEAYPDLLLAAADRFHTYAIPCKPLFDRAHALIESGQDLAIKKDLDMSAADLRKRAKLLTDLAGKWAKPHPSPKPRKTLTKPEPLFAEAGACFAYPVDGQGHCINPYFPAKAIAQDFEARHWGAFAVLWSGHADGYFAAALIARLKGPMAAMPGLDLLAESAVDWSLTVQDPQKGYPGIALGQFDRKHLQKMRAHLLGTLRVNPEAVAQRFPEVNQLPRELAAGVSNFLSYERIVMGGRPIEPISVREFLRA